MPPVAASRAPPIRAPKLLEQTCQVAEWTGHDYHSLLRGVHCCNHYRVIGCLSLATAHGAFTHSVSAAGILAQNHLVTTMQVLYFFFSSYVYLRRVVCPAYKASTEKRKWGKLTEDKSFLQNLKHRTEFTCTESAESEMTDRSRWSSHVVYTESLQQM